MIYIAKIAEYFLNMNIFYHVLLVLALTGLFEFNYINNKDINNKTSIVQSEKIETIKKEFPSDKKWTHFWYAIAILLVIALISFLIVLSAALLGDTHH